MLAHCQHVNLLSPLTHKLTPALSQPSICISPLPPCHCAWPCPTKWRPSHLQPHISAVDHCIHWLTPFSIGCLNNLASHIPHHLIKWERVVIAKAVSPKTLS